MGMVGLALVFTSVTAALGLPPGLLSAICEVETKHEITAINLNDGGTPSIGVCQIKLSTAKMLGFKGSQNELKNPKVNIYYSGLYLRWQLNRYGGDTLKAIAAYNAGTYRTNDYGLTKNRKYVHKVMVAWEGTR